jgi:cation:H+ antiporter
MIELRMNPSRLRQHVYFPAIALFMLAAGSLAEGSPSSVLWTAPTILVAAMLIAWAAESAQFFIAQGFALAILAWLQTLPEFAVEAVLAWKQEVPLLMANLTGALRLLTGLGWPMIYFTAAVFYRRRSGNRLNLIQLEDEHCVEVMGLWTSLAYAAVVCAKGTLTLVDAAVLVTIYVIYLLVLQRMPPVESERVDEMELIPRTIVKAPPLIRTTAIVGLFAGGGALIYFTAEPFLASLLGLSTALGVSQFVFVQWVAPFVSEFPEKVSAFYWARTVEGSSTAMMNMVSSNINQWTLLAAMLVIVYSISIGAPTAIQFDREQQMEMFLTLTQAILGGLFLLDLKILWWEAAGLFVLWAVQFALSPIVRTQEYFIAAYLIWILAEIARLVRRKRGAAAIDKFAKVWKSHIVRSR